MESEKILKCKLINMRKNHWKLPEEIKAYDFLMEVMPYLGSVDSELRDDLVLTGIYEVMNSYDLTTENLENILKVCLGDEYLFNRIGSIGEDDVFKRTFSILVVVGVLYINNEKDKVLLSREQILDIYNNIVNYCKRERDFRGYVYGKGWAHSTAHAADCLYYLAQNEVIKYEELIEILKVIREKICIYNYVYINGEDERLTTTVMSVFSRNIINIDEIKKWVSSFMPVNIPCKLHEKMNLQENIKIFMRSLFFRLRNSNGSQEIMDTIEILLKKLEEI